MEATYLKKPATVLPGVAESRHGADASQFRGARSFPAACQDASSGMAPAICLRPRGERTITYSGTLRDPHLARVDCTADTR